MPFHGGNTSSNLVRDASKINYLADFPLNLSNICLISTRVAAGGRVASNSGRFRRVIVVLQLLASIQRRKPGLEDEPEAIGFQTKQRAAGSAVDAVGFGGMLHQHVHVAEMPFERRAKPHR